MSRGRQRLLAALSTALLIAALAGIAANRASAAAGLTATFTRTSDWGTGYEATYRIANAGTSASTSWRLEFDLPANHRISSLWEGAWSQSGTHVTVTNTSWNGAIAPGSAVNVGFGVAYSGGYAAPANCLLDGGPCTGGGGNSPTATPTVTPTQTPTDPGTPGAYRTVGYFAQWGIYQRAFYPKTVETSGQAARLSTINYAFANVGADGRCFEKTLTGQGDAFADYQKSYDAATSVDGVADVWNQPLKGNFNQLKKLKAKHPGMTVMMSIGGWTWSKYFSDAALTDASRKAFVSSCIDLFLKGNLPQLDGDPAGGAGAAFGVFDGFDLDWEWPGSEGNTGNVIRPEDKHNYTLLMQEFRRQLDAYGTSVGRRYYLSAFLPADPAKIAAGIETSAVFGALDWGTVQGYDFYGAWDATTNHQGQLRSPAANPAPNKFSGDTAISAYLGQGAPAKKLLLGIPFYGRGWTNVPNTNRGVYQTGTAAPGTYEPGIEDYKKLKTLTGSRYYDDSIAVLWYFDGTTFWSYDDAHVIALKTAYVKSRALGGVMMWELDGDDGTLTAAVASGLA